MTVSVPAPPDILSPEHAARPVRDVPDPARALPGAVPRAHQQLAREPSRRRLAPVQDQGRLVGELLLAARARARADDHPDGGQGAHQASQPAQPVLPRPRPRGVHADDRGVGAHLGDPLFEREAQPSGAAPRSAARLDLVPEFTHQFPITVIEEMLALPKKDHPDFERWYVSIMEFLTNLSGEQEPIDRGLRTRQELAAYMLPLIAERRTGDGDDLLSRMCRAEIDGERSQRRRDLRLRQPDADRGRRDDRPRSREHVREPDREPGSARTRSTTTGASSPTRSRRRSASRRRCT